MKVVMLILIMVIALGVGVLPVSAYTLYQYAVNDNGSYAESRTPVGYYSGYSITRVFTTPGTYSYTVFFDAEIDEPTNTFFNEYGTQVGSAPAGLSWEIDEPGYFFGDIVNNVKAGTLDNTNGVPSSAPDDVSMALGWSFTLGAGKKATLVFSLFDELPGTEFYLTHEDPDSLVTLYYSATLKIEDTNGPAVPEPSTYMLLASGLGALWFARKRFVK